MAVDTEYTHVEYANAGDAPSGSIRSRLSALPLGTAVAKLRAVIETEDLWVLHEIDPQAIVKRAGYEIRRARQILFFHPRLIAQLLSADPGALLEAPLKFALIELPDGRTLVRWRDPAAALAGYGPLALAELGAELAAVCEQIADLALESDVPAAVDTNAEVAKGAGDV